MPEKTDQRQMKGLTGLAEGPAQVGSHKFGDIIFCLTMSVPLMSLLLFFTVYKVEGGTQFQPTTSVPLSV